MKYSVKIRTDLTFEVYYEGEKMKESKLKCISSKDFNACTATKEIISYLESGPENDPTDEDIIQMTITKLQDPQFDGNSKIYFLIEQLGLIFKIPTSPLITSDCILMGTNFSSLLQTITL